MNLAVDASSIINLNKAGALAQVCRLQRCHLHLSPIVVGECEPSCAAQIFGLAAHELISLIDDEQLSAEDYLALLVQHNLGEGELETILACQTLGYHMCCDDRRARVLAERLLGADRVVGSLRLLQWCVEDRLFSCNEAYGLFESMRDQGGFLPMTNRDFFCDGQAGC